MRAKEAEAWRELGATHLSINTMRVGLSSPTEHIKAIEEFKEMAASLAAG
jgi:hypothetical protein